LVCGAALSAAGSRRESPANERPPRRRAARLVRTLTPAAWPAAGRPPQNNRVKWRIIRMAQPIHLSVSPPLRPPREIGSGCRRDRI